MANQYNKINSASLPNGHNAISLRGKLTPIPASASTQL